jgi:hypothetical protein
MCANISIINLVTWWRWMISFMFWSVYFLYPLDRKRNSSKDGLNTVIKKNFLTPARNWGSFFLPVTTHIYSYSCYIISTSVLLELTIQFCDSPITLVKCVSAMNVFRIIIIKCSILTEKKAVTVCLYACEKIWVLWLQMKDKKKGERKVYSNLSYITGLENFQ